MGYSFKVVKVVWCSVITLRYVANDTVRAAGTVPVPFGRVDVVCCSRDTTVRTYASYQYVRVHRYVRKASSKSNSCINRGARLYVRRACTRYSFARVLSRPYHSGAGMTLGLIVWHLSP